MTPLESRRAERHQRYRLHAELGLAASLLVVTALFRIPLSPPAPAQDLVVENEVVQIEEVEITRHLEAPPPPPAAPPPVEVPDQVAVEEVLMPAVELNLDAAPPAPPPPPPPPAPRAEPPPPPEPVREPEPEVFVVVEQMPDFIGGIASIRQAYPEMERMAGIEGRVFVEFVVNEDGTVSDAVVIRGVSAGLDAAAVAAVREARFTPGHQRGRPVKVRMSIPITFRITS